MAKVGMPKSLTREAATSSCVERGFEAQRTTSAPPALRVMARFAVSVVTCRQAAILTPLRGFFLEKFSFMRLKTGMSISAHSILFLPFWLKAGSFTSYLTHYLRVIGFLDSVDSPLIDRRDACPTINPGQAPRLRWPPLTSEFFFEKFRSEERR